MYSIHFLRPELPAATRGDETTHTRDAPKLDLTIRLLAQACQATVLGVLWVLKTGHSTLCLGGKRKHGEENGDIAEDNDEGMDEGTYNIPHTLLLANISKTPPTDRTPLS